MPYYQVNFEIVGSCNAKCKWCVTGVRNRKGGSPFYYIKPSDFEKALIHLFENGFITSSSNIDIFNYGEPFLHPQINEIIGILERNKIKYGISTNASIVPQGLSSTTYENLQGLIFSMPGYSQKSYMRMHGFNFGKVKENILQILHTLRDRGFNGTAQISYHIYQYNLQELRYAESFAYENRMQFLPNVAYFCDLDMYYDYLANLMEPALMKDAQSELFLYYVENGRRNSRPTDYECPQLSDILVIDEQLNVLTCCGVDRYMRDATLGYLMNLTFLETALLKRSAPYCKKCMSAGIDYLIHHPPSSTELIGISCKPVHEVRGIDGSFLPCKLLIDMPVNESAFKAKGTLTISGWCLYGGKLDRLEVYCGNILLGVADYGLPRQDVYNAFPDYQDTKAGYSFTVDIALLPMTDSSHKISIIAYADDKPIAEQNINILIATPSKCDMEDAYALP